MALSWKKNEGVSTLVLIVSLMLVSTLFILFAAQYSALQQKISGNLYRNQQAFEAAQAGLEAAIPYFEFNYNAIVAGKSGGHLTPYLNSSTQNVALANGSQYSFVYTNPTANNYQLITLTATGIDRDGTATRVLTQQIQSYSASLPLPTVSLKIQGDVNLTNKASITNTTTNSNIDAGGNSSFSRNAHTSTSAGQASGASGLGSDVTENDSNLASQSAGTFFQNIFGNTSAAVSSLANYTFSFAGDHSYNSNLNGLTGAIIWINQLAGSASISSTTVVGSVAKPVILIISGNLILEGSAVINGFVFVLNPTTTVTLKNNVIVNGALSTTGNLSLQGGSALNYNATILNGLPAVGSTQNYAKVPASWRDF